MLYEGESKKMCKQDIDKKVGIVFVADHWGTYIGGIDVFNEKLCKEMAYVVDQSCVSVVCLVFGEVATQYMQECEKQGVKIVSYIKEQEEVEEAICSNARKLVVTETKCQYYIWIGHDTITGEKGFKLSSINEQDKFCLILHTDYLSTNVNKIEASRHFSDKIKEQENLIKNANWVFCVGPILYERFRNWQRNNKEVVMIIPGLEINNKLENRGENNLIMMSGRFDDDTEHQKRWTDAVQAIGNAMNKLAGKGRPILDYQVIIYGFSEGYTEEQLCCKREELLKKIRTKYKINMSLRLVKFDKERKEYLNDLERCSVFVMSSWIESFGLVAWEALERGIPIVISKNSGIYKYLDAELGYSLRGLCGSFDAGQGDVIDEMGKVISDMLSAKKVLESAEKLRVEMLKKNRWEKCAINMAKTIGIEDVMSDQVFTDSSCVEFIYFKRKFMFDELKKRVENGRVSSKIVFFDGISKKNILEDDKFFLALYELLSGKTEIDVYFAYPTRNAISERISQVDYEKVDIDILSEKPEFISNLKVNFEKIIRENKIDFDEEKLQKVLNKIYLVPLDKSPNVYINIIDDDWYFTIKYETRSSDNATMKLRIDGSTEGERQKESLKEYMEFILKASQESKGKIQMLSELKKW